MMKECDRIVCYVMHRRTQARTQETDEKMDEGDRARASGGSLHGEIWSLIAVAYNAVLWCAATTVGYHRRSLAHMTRKKNVTYENDLSRPRRCSPRAHDLQNEIKSRGQMILASRIKIRRRAFVCVASDVGTPRRWTDIPRRVYPTR